jgi:hypothetical protein
LFRIAFQFIPDSLVFVKSENSFPLTLDANENIDLHPDYDYDFIKYEDAKERFPLPDWLENFLKTQPVASHNNTLSDPDAKFIVLTCHKFQLTQMEDCGGLADSLCLLPSTLWLAHKTGRKLLIKYSKPAPLEHFLIPPSDGFDWRLPDGYFDAEWEAYANRTFKEMRDGRKETMGEREGYFHE